MGFLLESGFWWFFTIEFLRYGAIYVAGHLATHLLNLLRGAA